MRTYTPDEFEGVAFNAATIAQRVQQLGAQIKADYLGLGGPEAESVLAVGLMRGALTFLADLGRAVDLVMAYDLLWLSSYGDSDRPGEIELLLDLKTPLEGRHVLLVEDIVDTGHTLAYAHALFEKRHPASIRTCCLLDKRPRREVEVPVEYVGFVMEQDQFVVGYGLDYADRYRNLPYIAVLHPRVYAGS